MEEAIEAAELDGNLSGSSPVEALRGWAAEAAALADLHRARFVKVTVSARVLSFFLLESLRSKRRPEARRFE